MFILASTGIPKASWNFLQNLFPPGVEMAEVCKFFDKLNFLLKTSFNRTNALIKEVQGHI